MPLVRRSVVVCFAIQRLALISTSAWPRWQRRPRRGGLHGQGGGPAVLPQAPPIVAFPYDQAAASIAVDAYGRRLYFVLTQRKTLNLESLGRWHLCLPRHRDYGALRNYTIRR